MENKSWCVAGTSNNFFHFIVQVALPVCRMIWQVWVTNIHKFLKAWLTSRTDQSYSDSRYYSIITIKWEIGTKVNPKHIRFVNFTFDKKNPWENLNKWITFFSVTEAKK